MMFLLQEEQDEHGQGKWEGKQKDDFLNNDTYKELKSCSQ
jgi:hypothetical protein